MTAPRDPVGRLANRVGSRVPLVLGSLATTGPFAFLAIAHDEPWEFHTASAMQPCVPPHRSTPGWRVVAARLVRVQCLLERRRQLHPSDEHPARAALV